MSASFLARKAALVVPCVVNFEGLAKLFASVDVPVLPLVIPNWEYNVGVAAAWNKGIAEAARQKCDVCYVINDDVEMFPGALASMAKALLTTERILVSAYESPADDHADRKIWSHATYSCFAVSPASFLKATGGEGFDTGFFPAYFEDDDMRYRMKLLANKWGNGRKPDGYAPDARYRHQRSSTKRLAPHLVTDQMFVINKERYILKWGGAPGHEAYITPYGE